jgi:hypothetical protein
VALEAIIAVVLARKRILTKGALVELVRMLIPAAMIIVLLAVAPVHQQIVAHAQRKLYAPAVVIGAAIRTDANLLLAAAA